MPNHVQNILYVGAETNERVHEIFEAIRGESEDDEPCLIDFEKIVPMPSCLKIGNAPCVDESIPLTATKEEIMTATIKKAATYDWKSKWEVQDDEQFMKLLADRVDRDYEARQIYAKNVAETRFQSWYDWSYANWGTKWSAYEQTEGDNNSIRFWTANGPAIPVIKALSKMFPDAKFKLEYSDQDIGNQLGSVTFKDGCVVEEVNYPYGHAAINFACDLWGYDDYDRARYHCWCENIDPDENPEALEEWGYVDEEANVAKATEAKRLAEEDAKEVSLKEAQEAINNELGLLSEE